VTSFGILAAGGILSLVLGSMMLIDSPAPGLQIGLRVILPVTVATAGIVLFLVGLAVRARRTPVVTGQAGMLHEVGHALSSIEPGGVGRVRAHGEIWTATSAERVTEGDIVRITAVQGLLLVVAPEKPLRSGGQFGGLP
jgi:membrane-bound serine protease (ClpP class)